MAYDIHIDLEKNSKRVSEYQFGIREEVHEQLFYSEFCKINEFPFFKRMSNYYRDSKYQGAEINSLLKELNSLIAEFTENVSAEKALCELKLVCKKL